MSKKQVSKKEEPKNIYGYRSQADNAIFKSLKNISGMAFGAIMLACMNIVLTIVTLCLVVNSDGIGSSKTQDKWIEMTSENNVGYEVISTWTTSVYEGSLIFQPTDATAISVSSENLDEVNKRSKVKCTYDTLLEYIQFELSTDMSDSGVSIFDVSYKEYSILDTRGYYVTFSQRSSIEGQEMTTYQDSLFFIYDSYLYTFTYSSAYKGVVNSDYQHVLDSIRIIPESDMTVLDFGVTADPSIVGDYADWGSDIADSINSNASSTTTMPDEVKSEEDSD